MANSYKVIAQANPAGAPAVTGPNTTIYTVPASTSVVASSLTVCNQSASDTTFSLAVIPSGVTGPTAHNTVSQTYVFYDYPVSAKSTLTVTSGLTLSAGDSLAVYTPTGPTGPVGAAGPLSISLFGDVIT